EGFAEAAAVFTDDPDVQLRAGATLFEQGRYREALPYLALAVDLDPSSPVALEYLVKAESKVGRADSAEWLMFEAIRDGIRPGVFHAVRGEHKMDAGIPGAAAGSFERALLLGRPEIPTRIRLADGLAAAGQTIRARMQYQLAVSRRPSSAEARDALGRFYLATGEFERGVLELEEAVGLEPGEALYWNNLGAGLRMAGRPEDSLPAIEEAVRLDPLAPEPYYNRGLTLKALGRTEEARRQFLLALELDPQYKPAVTALLSSSR
ncbi:MAG TPA: tetratricopeptide repeat protein, partial [bacterium]|nr:tetratricopeptide repeat protein [bacterium]